MTKKTWTHFTLPAGFLGLMLSTTPSQAQSKPAGLRGIHHVASTASQEETEAAVPAALPSPTYTFTLINFPGAPDTGLQSLNPGATASLQGIVGGYGPTNDISGGGSGLFLLNAEGTGLFKGVFSETLLTVDFPSGSHQIAYGVNDSAQIVGSYADSLGVNHGYELSGGKFTTLDVPFSGATGTLATGINNAKDIVGGWSHPALTSGFKLSGATYTRLDFPAATQTFAYAINNAGDITGYYDDASSVGHGFLLSGGTYTSIDVPGAVETIAIGINDGGDVVGFYCTTAACITNLEGAQGFLLSKGVFSTIIVPGASGTVVSGISNNGVIVGGYLDCAGIDHGFLATP